MEARFGIEVINGDVSVWNVYKQQRETFSVEDLLSSHRQVLASLSQCDRAIVRGIESARIDAKAARKQGVVTGACPSAWHEEAGECARLVLGVDADRDEYRVFCDAYVAEIRRLVG